MQVLSWYERERRLVCSTAEWTPAVCARAQPASAIGWHLCRTAKTRQVLVAVNIAQFVEVFYAMFPELRADYVEKLKRIVEQQAIFEKQIGLDKAPNKAVLHRWLEGLLYHEHDISASD